MTGDVHGRWFETFRTTPVFARLRERPVAYFCAEYALDPGLRQYAGGLGVLAGDMVREAADRGIPLVGVGLYYHEGYLCPTKDVGGRTVEICVRRSPAEAGLESVVGPDGERVRVTVPIEDRQVRVQAWRWRRGDVQVLLLDADVEGNEPTDRRTTDRLYVSDKQTRLRQELILGIGGLRMLEALDIHPSIYHLNEGHSALLAFELIRHEMQERGLGFDEAKQFARRRTILTNHTLVPAGNEVYSNDLVALALGRYAEELSVPVSELVKLGLVQESSVFSMTMLAFRTSAIINSVSRLHAKKAKEIWTDHPMVAVTNGVHVPSWDRVGEAAGTPAGFWARHLENKRALLDVIREKTGRSWDEEHLLIGWARRIVRYKRPLALLEDLGRFLSLARSSDRPIRLIFAGQPHPGDEDGQALRKELLRLVDGDLKDVAAYLPDYDLDSAGSLVAGCDLWLNTPVVGFEACGTSGMKAALNGVLPFSTPDGWVAEADLFRVGWSIGSDHVAQDGLDRLDRDILPMYYARNADGVPEEWTALMRHAREMAANRFSATRMLREYVEMLYS
jgi:starch phosphorylase